jgi:hypothetical protein
VIADEIPDSLGGLTRLYDWYLSFPRRLIDRERGLYEPPRGTVTGDLTGGVLSRRIIPKGDLDRRLLSVSSKPRM